MDDGAQAMLRVLDAGFPRVEEMTGPQARAAVARRRVPASNVNDVHIGLRRGGHAARHVPQERR
jgi:hypothetical protein